VDRIDSEAGVLLRVGVLPEDGATRTENVLGNPAWLTIARPSLNGNTGSVKVYLGKTPGMGFWVKVELDRFRLKTTTDWFGSNTGRSLPVVS